MLYWLIFIIKFSNLILISTIDIFLRLALIRHKKLRNHVYFITSIYNNFISIIINYSREGYFIIFNLYLRTRNMINCLLIYVKL